MQLFKYVIAVLILCGIPDIILFRLFYKWRNKTLKSLQWTSVIILLVVFSFAMIARYFTVSMVPMLAFGFVVMFFYIPKWFFWPFALLHHVKIGVSLAIISAIIVLYGVTFGRTGIITKQVDVYSYKIPESFEGYKIMQFSDIHLGSLIKGSGWIEALPDSLNQQEADLLLFTGDLVNMYALETFGWDSLFLRMEAADGKFAVRGNHDYSAYLDRGAIYADSATNIEHIEEAFGRFGFMLLNDTAAIINRGADKIAILGTENIGKPPFPQIGSVKEAVSAAGNVPCKILMTHDAAVWDSQIANVTDVMLTLSGHTHAAQMGVESMGVHWSPAKFIHKYWDGIYGNNAQLLYVNRGVGYITFPMRMGMSPEITLFVLHHSKEPAITYSVHRKYGRHPVFDTDD